jgi:hypothetical protein
LAVEPSHNATDAAFRSSGVTASRLGLRRIWSESRWLAGVRQVVRISARASRTARTIV